MDRPDISIVVPMYDEEDNAAPMCTAIRDALAGWDRTYEVVLVDDGSTDATLERLADEAKRDPRVRVIALRRNSGQTLAMATGFARARGRVIVSMDGDLQNDPRDIPRVVSRLDDGFDVVCGWRKDRKDAFVSRTLPSKVANWMIATITGIPIHDNGCSLKAYRAEIMQSVALYSEMHRFLPALSSMTGARIDEIVVRHHPRVHGESKYGISRTFKVLGDMIVIKMITQFGSRPGRWFAALSLPWLVAGVLVAAGWLGAGMRGSIVFPALAVVCVYLFGHLMSLAMLGEAYLASSDRDYLKRLAGVLSVERRLDGLGASRARGSA